MHEEQQYTFIVLNLGLQRAVVKAISLIYLTQGVSDLLNGPKVKEVSARY